MQTTLKCLFVYIIFKNIRTDIISINMRSTSGKIDIFKHSYDANKKKIKPNKNNAIQGRIWYINIHHLRIAISWDTYYRYKRHTRAEFVRLVLRNLVPVKRDEGSFFSDLLFFLLLLSDRKSLFIKCV